MNSIARGLILDCRFDNFDFQFGTNCYACNIDRSHSPAQPWNFLYVHCFRHIFSFTFTLSRSFESHEWYEWFQLFLFSSIVCVLFFKLVLFVTSGAIQYAAICIENIEIIEFKSSEIIQRNFCEPHTASAIVCPISVNSIHFKGFCCWISQRFAKFRQSFNALMAKLCKLQSGRWNSHSELGDNLALAWESFEEFTC